MFDFIKKLFGEGKVRVEFTLSDGTTGAAKIPYIGAYDESEVLRYANEAILVETGKRAMAIKIVGHVCN